MRRKPMRRAFVVTVAGIGTALLATGGLAQNRPVEFLTREASTRDPLEIALDFIRQDGAARGLSEADLQDAKVLSRTVSSHSQTTHIQLRQRLGGIEVANANT